jgi:polyisoprenyl-teichoic acid--peptidoglycan teichoic acid transferase
MNQKPKRQFNDFFVPQNPNAARRLDEFKTNLSRGMNEAPKSFFDDIPNAGPTPEPIQKAQNELNAAGFTNSPKAENMPGFVNQQSTTPAPDLSKSSHYSLESYIKSHGPVGALESRRATRSNRKFSPVKFIKRSAMLVTVLVVLGGGYYGSKLYFAKQRIFQSDGSVSAALRQSTKPSDVQTEGDGRVNILLAGRGGEGHEAGDLTDTIIVASIDPLTKKAALLSIPRDLYVKVPGFYSTRINSAFEMGASDAKGDEKAGIKLLERTLEETLGIPIHYYALVDFTAFKSVVDAVGGVTVNIEGTTDNCPVGSNTRGVYDPIFDWQFGKNSLKLNGGPQKLTGTQALLLSRARNSGGGCGIAGSDISRGENQRKVMLAIKEKALSLGTFSNPIKISQLIDAVGDHVRTNIGGGEIGRLYEVGKDITSDNVQSLGLRTDEVDLLRDANINGASVLVPSAGNGDFSDIKEFVRKSLIDGYIAKEKAKVAVLNASGVSGAAKLKSELLKSYGYDVVYVGDAEQDSKVSKIIELTKPYSSSSPALTEKPFTKRYLEQRFKASAVKSARPADLASTDDVDFVIILGIDSEDGTE